MRRRSAASSTIASAAARRCSRISVACSWPITSPRRTTCPAPSPCSSRTCRRSRRRDIRACSARSIRCSRSCCWRGGTGRRPIATPCARSPTAPASPIRCLWCWRTACSTRTRWHGATPPPRSTSTGSTPRPTAPTSTPSRRGSWPSSLRGTKPCRRRRRSSSSTARTGCCSSSSGSRRSGLATSSCWWRCWWCCSRASASGPIARSAPRSLSAASPRRMR